MNKSIFLALVFILTTPLLYAQTKGVVYDDLNNNNIFDTVDKPVVGAVVSNGKQSVKSNNEGVYELPQYDKEKFIFISTPSGYTYTTNFYYRKTDATDFNFSLKKVKNQPRRFIQITDTETYNYGDWIDDLKKYVRNNDVSFINLTGDICYEQGLEFHGKNFTDQNLWTRVVTSLGNHDLVGKNHFGEHLFEDIFGPVWYSLNVGGVHFVNTPMAGGDRTPSYTTNQMLEWLEGDLAQLDEGTPIVIFNHDIVFNNGEFIYKTKNREFDLNKYNLRGWLYGHWHVNSFKQYGDIKVYGTSSPNKGGIDHSPSCFRVLEFDKEGVISSELKYTSIKHSVVANLTKESEVVANIYSSSTNVLSATLKAGNKQYTLRQQSDWFWRVTLPKSSNVLAMVLNVKFEDGTTLASHVGVENSQLSPQLEWAENYLGGNSYMSSPVLCGQNIMYATIDDNGALKSGITALNRKTGALVWVFKSHSSIKNNFVTDEKSVFASDVEGYLYKLDAKTGALLGEKKLQQGLMAPNNLGIVLDKGVVYAGHGSNFSAIDSDSFTRLWRADSNGGGEGTNITVTVLDDIVFTGSFWGARYANDVNTGETLWQLSDNGARFCVSSATPYKGKLYFTSSENVHEVDPRTGKTIRLVNSGFQLATASQPIVTDKFIIVGTANEGVIALNRSTLELAWNFKTKPAMVYTVAYKGNQEKIVESTLILKGETLYFGASDGYLYAIDYNKGVFKWRYNIGSPILSKVTLDNDNNLYLNDLGGTLYKFNL